MRRHIAIPFFFYRSISDTHFILFHCLVEDIPILIGFVFLSNFLPTSLSLRLDLFSPVSTPIVVNFISSQELVISVHSVPLLPPVVSLLFLVVASIKISPAPVFPQPIKSVLPIKLVMPIKPFKLIGLGVPISILGATIESCALPVF